MNTITNIASAVLTIALVANGGTSGKLSSSSAGAISTPSAQPNAWSATWNTDGMAGQSLCLQH
jgi:hypothetical protein